MKSTRWALLLLCLVSFQRVSANYPIFTGDITNLASQWDVLANEHLAKSRSIYFLLNKGQIGRFSIIFNEDKYTFQVRVSMKFVRKPNFASATMTLRKDGWIHVVERGFESRELELKLAERFVSKVKEISSDVIKLSEVGYFDDEGKQVASCQHILDFKVPIKDIEKLKELVILYFSHNPERGNIEVYENSIQ